MYSGMYMLCCNTKVVRKYINRTCFSYANFLFFSRGDIGKYSVHLTFCSTYVAPTN